MSLLRGAARQAHTEDCRKRLETILKGTVRSDEVDRRTTEYMARMLKKSEAKRIDKERAEAEAQKNPKNPKDGKDEVMRDGVQETQRSRRTA